MPMFHDQVWVYRQAIARLEGLVVPEVKEAVSEAVQEMPVTQPDLPDKSEKCPELSEKCPITQSEPEPEGMELNVTSTGQLSFF